jgi:Protein of unknown function (DUF3168)
VSLLLLFNPNLNPSPSPSPSLCSGDPSLALQAMIRARLIADAATTALVPATNILDRNHRPEQFPAIIIGEGQALMADNFDSFHDQAFTNVHIWAQEIGLGFAKSIAGAVKRALQNGPWVIDGYRAINVRTVSAKYLRDSELGVGPISHVVLTVEAIVIEVVA